MLLKCAHPKLCNCWDVTIMQHKPTLNTQVKYIGVQKKSPKSANKNCMLLKCAHPKICKHREVPTMIEKKQCTLTQMNWCCNEVSQHCC